MNITDPYSPCEANSLGHTFRDGPYCDHCGGYWVTVPSHGQPSPVRPLVQTNRQRVIQFNQEILGIGERPVGLLDAAEMMLSLKQLREEIQEMEDAFNKGDLVGVVDGLVDLDFFTRGVVYKHGLCPEAYSRCFKAVFEANMQKALGKKKGRDEFGDVADAIKPEGWQPPEELIRTILEEYVK